MIKAMLRLLIILLILLLGIITFFMTPTGLQFSTRFASDFLPGTLTVKKIQGIFIGPITIHDLHYEDQNQIIDIKKLRFDWHPFSLLNKQLHITDLTIDDFHLVTSKNALPEKWSIETLEKTWATMLATLQKRNLPFHITIDHAIINHLDVLDPATQIHIYSNAMQFHIIFTQKIWDGGLQADIYKPIPLQLQVKIHGKPDAYQGTLMIAGKNTHLEVIGNGDRDSLSAHTVKNNFLQGALNLQLQLHWKNTMHWQGILSGENINTQLISPEWLRNLSFDLKSQGDAGNNILTTESDVNINLPMGHVQLTLARTNTWNVAWQMQMHSLAYFGWNIKGALTSSGQIHGDLNNPTIHAVIQGHLETALADIDHLNAIIDGDLKNQSVVANLAMFNEKLHLALTGHWNQPRWTGLLQTLTLQGKRTGTWQLQKQSSLMATKNGGSWSPFCIANKREGVICSQGKILDNKIDALLQANMRRFTWLIASIEHVRIPDGKLIANLHVHGPIEKPLVTGTAQLHEGHIVLPRLNVTLDNVTVNVMGDGRTLAVNAQGFTQKQPIKLTGAIDLSNLTAPLQFTLTANNALIINTDEYKIYATANIKGTLKNKITSFSGTILIPKALIQPNDFQTTVTLPEHDIVYVLPKNAVTKSEWQLDNNFKLTLGNDVEFKAFGVNAEFGGAIQLSQEAQKALFATGEIFVRKGTYSVYGQTLTVEPGSNLTYNNNALANPTFNLRASKTISSTSTMAGGVPTFSDNDLLVGVEIHGIPKAYHISFYSNKSRLSQADILSYILLGYGTSANTPGNTDFMLRALAAVKIPSQGLMGKQNIAAQIQQGLGLNELGVESETTTDELGNPLNQQTAFVVGKSLTPHLFVRYSISLLDQVNLVQVRYIFKKHWGIQGDSSSLGNGGDILYMFSKN